MAAASYFQFIHSQDIVQATQDNSLTLDNTFIDSIMLKADDGWTSKNPNRVLIPKAERKAMYDAMDKMLADSITPVVPPG